MDAYSPLPHRLSTPILFPLEFTMANGHERPCDLHTATGSAFIGETSEFAAFQFTGIVVGDAQRRAVETLAENIERHAAVELEPSAEMEPSVA